MSGGKHWVSVTLKELRKSKKITQKELAKICDIHFNTIRRIERGDVNVSFLTIEKIFEVLGHEVEIHKVD